MEQNIYIIERPFRLFLCRAEKMWSESSKTTPRTRFTQRDFDERDTRLMGEAFQATDGAIAGGRRFSRILGAGRV
jgi:hypothetical protein